VEEARQLPEEVGEEERQLQEEGAVEGVRHHRVQEEGGEAQ
jgi:hypothetical protein